MQFFRRFGGLDIIGIAADLCFLHGTRIIFCTPCNHLLLLRKIADRLLRIIIDENDLRRIDRGSTVLHFTASQNGLQGDCGIVLHLMADDDIERRHDEQQCQQDRPAGKRSDSIPDAMHVRPPVYTHSPRRQ